jgi:hypothetical protein
MSNITSFNNTTDFPDFNVLNRNAFPEQPELAIDDRISVLFKKINRMLEITNLKLITGTGLGAGLTVVGMKVGQKVFNRLPVLDADQARRIGYAVGGLTAVSGIHYASYLLDYAFFSSGHPEIAYFTTGLEGGAMCCSILASCLEGIGGRAQEADFATLSSLMQGYAAGQLVFGLAYKGKSGMVASVAAGSFAAYKVSKWAYNRLMGGNPPPVAN